MKKNITHLLLFEDNPGDARLMREYLLEDETTRFEIQIASRLSEGLARLAETKPDIVLVDLGLPDSQGLATFNTIHDHRPELPIVVLTGLADMQQATLAMLAGAQDYLTKDEVTSSLLRRSLHYAIERKQAEILQEVLYKITRAADQAASLDTLYPAIHTSIRQVMVADNFYIALYDETDDLLRFPYFIDLEDQPEGPKKPGKGLTEYVIRTGRSVLCDKTVFDDLNQRGEIERVGAPSPIWLGVPLIIEARVIGAMVVQDYHDPHLYSERELHILEFVSSQVATTIFRKQAELDLKTSHSLLAATIESTADGILVVDTHGRIQLTNHNFAEMWAIPQEVLATGQDEAALAHILNKLKDPQAFLARVQELYATPAAESFEVIEFKDGRLFERLSRPQYQGAEVVGRVWSFRDVSEKKRSEALIQARLHLIEFAATHSIEELLQQTLAEVEHLTASSISFLHFVGPDQANIIQQAWSARTRKEFCTASGPDGLHYPVEDAGVWADCVRQKAAVIHNDYGSLPHRKGLPAGHSPLIRELVVPILQGNQVVAILGVGNKALDYTRQDVDLVTFLAETVWELAEQKRTAKILLDSEQKYHSLFDNVPDGVYRTTPDGKILAVNQAFARILGYASETELVNESALTFFANTDDRQIFLDQMDAHGEVHNLEIRYKRKDGSTLIALENARTIYAENGSIISYEGTLTDITELKTNEARLHKQQGELSRLYHASESLLIGTAQDLKSLAKSIVSTVLEEFEYSNCSVFLVRDDIRTLERLAVTGPYRAEVSTKNLDLDGAGLVPEAVRSGRVLNIPDVTSRPGYLPNWSEARSELTIPLMAGERTLGVIDIQSAELNAFSADDERLMVIYAGRAALALSQTIQFEHEKRRNQSLSELQILNTRLNSLHTEREVLDTLVRQAALVAKCPVSTVMYLNDQADQVSLVAFAGLPAGTPLGLTIPITFLPGLVQQNLASREPIIVQNVDRDLPGLRSVLVRPDIQSFYAFPLIIDARLAGFITLSSLHPRHPSESELHTYQLLARLASAALDNVRLFESTNRNLMRMSSLRRVDLAISSSFDLIITLNILLEQVTSYLNVDAADILVYDQRESVLKYTCGRGFRSQALKFTNLRLGEGYAGQAAMKRSMVIVPDLQKEPNELVKSMSLASEEFVSYWGISLTAKGHLQGVLEVFHRQPFQADQEWLDFLETMAGQAAIAIDNVILFNDLERSNADLSLAYDNTLEGWASALELRDNETQGHTRRVAAMAIQLAVKMKVRDQEKMYMRWGALLHDIGKMGIPDQILLKPGPLTDEEWVIMRKHPKLAFEMLAPISYLRNALDIPFCHHEKWNGKGYPRGLKETQIPIAARIFAIVDVWDALISDRPYRKAWTPEKTKEYIQAESGKHFDPQVVQAFLELIESESFWLPENRG
jgi:PAS domain S-box-containing protein/putative nucleotidyltransferase with HDIG domain